MEKKYLRTTLHNPPYNSYLMGERKTVSKYYPVRFDWKQEFDSKPKIDLSDPRRKSALKKKGFQKKVRLMIPFTFQCAICKTYIPRGRKFYARQESAPEHSYLGIEAQRFYIRCPDCDSELAFRTDPEHECYQPDINIILNIDQTKLALERKKASEPKEDDSQLDALQALELRTLETQRLTRISNNLGQLQELNSLKESMKIDDVMSWLSKHRSKPFTGTEILIFDESDSGNLVDSLTQTRNSSTPSSSSFFDRVSEVHHTNRVKRNRAFTHISAIPSSKLKPYPLKVGLSAYDSDTDTSSSSDSSDSDS